MNDDALNNTDLDKTIFENRLINDVKSSFTRFLTNNIASYIG